MRLVEIVVVVTGTAVMVTVEVDVVVSVNDEVFVGRVVVTGGNVG